MSQIDEDFRYVLSLTVDEFDAVQAALMFASTLSRSAVSSALDKTVDLRQEARGLGLLVRRRDNE